MTRVACGWCGYPTARGACAACAHDPELPYLQRGAVVPVVEEHHEGRPGLEEREIRARYDAARRALVAEGRPVSVEAIAERLERSPRTVRDWKKRFSLR